MFKRKLEPFEDQLRLSRAIAAIDLRSYELFLELLVAREVLVAECLADALDQGGAAFGSGRIS